MYSTLDSLTKYVVAETNRYIANEFRVYGKTLQQIKDNMNTADFTKLFQYIVNEVIEAGITHLAIDGKREEVDGYDYIINGKEVEFKLNGGNQASSFATGNKTSHFGGKKAPLVWCIKYTFENNQIASFAMVLIDCDKAETNVWKSSAGRKDSFSTLKLLKEEVGCVLGCIGELKAAQKYLQLNTIPVHSVL